MRSSPTRLVLLLSSVAFAMCVGCGGGGDAGQDAAGEAWTSVHTNLRPALLSVWGTSASDVWTVGGDPDGDGPAVLHWDGAAWTSHPTGDTGDLWWVFGFAGGPVYVGGEGGRILRWQAGAFTALATPTTDTVFGIWGSGPTDVWAVGGAEGGASGAFVWKLDGDAFVPAPGLPSGLAERGVLWKVAGASADDVWMVGTSGLGVHWDGLAFAEESLGTGESLFTVAYADGRYAAAGGFGSGLVLEHDGAGWPNVAPSDASGMIGIALAPGGGGVAVGSFGEVLERVDGAWRETTGPLTEEALHAVWIDPDGGVWTVGGQVQASPLVRGLLAYRGDATVTGELR